MYDMNYKTLTRTTAPASEPITLTEAKSYMRVDETADDTLITSLIVAARELCEQYLNRSLITQTWTLTLDEFPPCDILLYKGPVQSVTSVKYYDDDDNPYTYDSSLYHVDAGIDDGRIALPLGGVWVVTTSYPRTVKAVEVVYVTGYGDNASDVPQAIKQGLLMLVAHMYEHRSDSAPVHNTVTLLWENYRIERL